MSNICTTTSFAGVFIQGDTQSRKAVRHRSVRANMLDSVSPSNEDDDYFGFAYDASSDIICNSTARRIARNRCRYQYLNDPYAHNIARSFAVTVIGTGAELQVTRVMGQACDTEDFRAARELVEERFRAWAGSVDLFGKLFLMVKSLMFDGESFLRFVRNPSKPNDLDVTVIDAQRVTEGYPNYSDQNTIDGIGFDGYGNPVSYSVLKTVLNQSYMNWADFEVVSADQIYHLYVQELPEQHRGLPLMQSSLKHMSALRRYNAAVVEAAEEAACISVLIKTPYNANLNAPVIAEEMDVIDIPRRGGLTLPDGADASQLKAEQPTAQHREFVATNLTAIGAGCGLPRNMASND